VSGSLSTASNFITNLGTWLSIIVLLVAVGLAVLFTTSGIARRTRELGTLKAIGWSNGRIVRQVAGESMVQSLIGGVAGLAVGLIGILTINVIAPTISAGTEAQGAMGGGGEAGGAPGGGGGAPDAIGEQRHEHRAAGTAQRLGHRARPRLLGRGRRHRGHLRRLACRPPQPRRIAPRGRLTGIRHIT
jgi:hypothetical protein